ncbi:MAG: tyrosine-protein phosphatase [Paracoccus sp. (in: a-proteobacteria)]|uniref:tyrosine-protein phosphatase n=1 Tax=Paracoccus sp. TaxID=267 RepID=UPI0026DF2E21|nr:tyrosine-protein phosphatase [Paracoccus sp. (in: a-proteobacteria)]MDO5631760.1 tyrosine-protein phosphatase [Paracoccus sp. (in: a-proteobacteria)]
MKRMARRAGLVALALLTVAIGWLGFLLASGNTHPVILGELYRSAQPDTADLAQMQRDHGIASIINLRGANPDTAWYQDEIRASADLSITHYDFRMSAASELTADEAHRLLALMRDAPKPLLIHCKSGADRTGLAAALYVAGIAKHSEFAAEWQLSPRYGHVGIPWLSHAWPMDMTWEAMEPALGITGS